MQRLITAYSLRRWLTGDWRDFFMCFCFGRWNRSRGLKLAGWWWMASSGLYGIGKLLMERAEMWAREHGCKIVSLRSNVIRERAHAFYERLGYKHVKTQKSFRKVLQD